MTDLSTRIGGAITLENPFPGLRPFEQHESALFFGRDEQCDDLLTRLSRRRLIAVVGMSGSGKSSLVRAGLLPALDRGYVPSAGSSWHIAVFRPGSEPLANLADALARHRLPDGALSQHRSNEIHELLDSSSLGLVKVARRLLSDPADSLLVVADQFEEIFRSTRIAVGPDARDQAAACVDLLVNASRQDEVPVYVVLTMRSDYLGDCAQFTGLPEALNDSQFLVPRMTRAQLRAAIECPVSVRDGLISPGLVQRLLHDVEQMGRADDDRMSSQEGQDHLPVLQHALTRMWHVSPEVIDTRTKRLRKSLDFPQYVDPRVRTLKHALNLHAEEVYSGLPTDRHREVARLVFQQLTNRGIENRNVRRPTNFRELAAVALRRAPEELSAQTTAVVREVLDAFSGKGRGFVVVNAQQDVDISHESLIRRWERLQRWVDEESRSRRIYMRLAETASNWELKRASLYRGPELAEAREWWQRETPTQLWADRYDRRFETASRFLAKSIARRRLQLWVLFGNVALLLIAGVAIVALSVISRNEARRAESEARRAETAALDARTATDTAKREQEEAARLFAAALDAQRRGRSELAEQLAKQAQQFEQQAKDRPSLTPSEVSELQRLRQLEASTRSTIALMEKEIATLREAAKSPASGPTPADVAKLEQQLADAKDRAEKQEQSLNTVSSSEAALKKSNEDLRAQLAELADRRLIEQLLRDYETAYEKRDAPAVVKLVPTLSLANLQNSFSQMSTYELEILKPDIVISGNSGTVTFVRRISIVPRVGSRPAPETIPTTLRVRRGAGTWVIDAVE